MSFSSIAGFLDLFPGVASDSLDKMTVLTVCQRTQNDMTSWNSAVEKEREELLGIVSIILGSSLLTIGLSTKGRRSVSMRIDMDFQNPVQCELV